MQNCKEKQKKKVTKAKKQNAYFRHNAVFGKSIENPMSKFGVKSVTTRKQYLKW